MIVKHLSVMWSATAPEIGDHLWQSTLVAIIAGLLTLTLRRNRAQYRYVVWLIASLKFLFPFSLLVGVGSALAWLRGSLASKDGLYLAMEEATQPFTIPTVFPSVNRFPVGSVGLNNSFSAILIAIWLCGLGTVLFIWYLRWCEISAVVRKAQPIPERRELKMLHKLERVSGARNRIEILVSQGSLEPGIFGIVRPVLVWPEGISERLDDAHLEAIIAHELCHVRRRDNLAASIHMLVEAIFWFHPLVWWLGKRLLEERERACDEAVLESSGSPRVYAESILKICEFCVGSRFRCVSGVTGAGLKKRITRIMGETSPHRLDAGRKLLLSAAALVVLATPVALGLLHSAPGNAAMSIQSSGQLSVVDWQTAAGGKQSFKFASVRRNTSGSESSSMNVPTGPGEDHVLTEGLFIGKNLPLVSYIYFAYKITGGQLQLLVPHLPEWILKERYDVEARASGNPTKDQLRLMMQSLLEERFKLASHYESQPLPIFDLVLENPGSVGPQLRSHIDDPPCAVAARSSSPGSPAETSSPSIAKGFPVACGGIIGMTETHPGRLRAGARNIPIDLLAGTLAQMGNLDRVVIDKTGLRGTYDFTFEWTPQHSHPLPSGVNGPMDEPSPNFLEDLRQQLGLTLNRQTSPVRVFVVDHAEQPSVN